MTKNAISAILLCTLLISCRQKSPIPPEPISISSSNPYLFFDSASIDNFLLRNRPLANQRTTLFNFYQKSNFRFAWMRTDGIDEQAGNFINLLSNETYINANKSAVFTRLSSLFNELTETPGKISAKDTTAIELELLLSSSFFDYAERNWGGINEEYSRKVNWFIDRKQLDYSALLDSMLSGRLKEEPVYRQYHLLKQYLSKYDSIEKSGNQYMLSLGIKKLQMRDTSSFIPLIKRKMFLLGDLASNDNSTLFDPTLFNAVMEFQRRHGLTEDGIIAANTLQAMNVSIHDRIQQIIVNMERCRWVPLELSGDFVVVNIPAFKLYAHHNNRPQWSCNVVVGKETTKTAIFNGTFQYIVFNPYWNIPRSILIKEILPDIKRQKNYLRTHNMEVYGSDGNTIPSSAIAWNKYPGNSFPYGIRQCPGNDNALGRIKFLFPNAFGMYLHDTPAKSLFGETKRTFSHGCIRVEDARKLAEFLIRNEDHWTEKTIEKEMTGTKEKYIKLKRNIPVFIAYFTAWVDKEGKINFRDDVYGHDKKLKELIIQ